MKKQNRQRTILGKKFIFFHCILIYNEKLCNRIISTNKKRQTLATDIAKCEE
jgi:hypothetical protein